MRERGRYTGNATGITVSAAKNTGTPQVVIDFDVFRNDGTPDGQATVYLPMSEAAWQYSEAKLRRMEFNGDFKAPALGKPDGVPLNLKHDSYQGKEQEKWDIGGGAPPPASQDVLANLAARWKTNNATTTKKPAPKPPSTPPKIPPPSAPPAEKEPGGGCTTQQEAWDAWCAAYPDGPDVKQWNAAIAKVSADSKVPAAKFGAAQWDDVASAAIPY